jgi:hypothetical protein
MRHGSATKPDFSGTWILNRQASTLSPGADTVQSAQWQIDHRDPAFRKKAAFVMAAGPRDFEFELQADGIETEGGPPEAVTACRLAWEGDGLVVTFRTRLPHGVMVVAFRYELVDDGRRLRASEQLRGTDHDQDNIWVFDRG